MAGISIKQFILMTFCFVGVASAEPPLGDPAPRRIAACLNVDTADQTGPWALEACCVGVGGDGYGIISGKHAGTQCCDVGSTDDRDQVVECVPRMRALIIAID